MITSKQYDELTDLLGKYRDAVSYLHTAAPEDRIDAAYDFAEADKAIEAYVLGLVDFDGIDKERERQKMMAGLSGAVGCVRLKPARWLMCGIATAKGAVPCLQMWTQRAGEMLIQITGVTMASGTTSSPIASPTNR